MNSEDLGYYEISIDNLRMIKIMHDAGYDVSHYSDWSVEAYAYSDFSFDIFYDCLHSIFSGAIDSHNFYADGEIEGLEREDYDESAIIIQRPDIVAFFDSLEKEKHGEFLDTTDLAMEHLKGRGIFIFFENGFWLGDMLEEFIDLEKKISEAIKNKEREAEHEVSDNVRRTA
ncbi:hypothetical protein [Niallia taxi]|uniref:hypothetical protein n=1 Tax=Niallia taxi TaxID=2499688 RepID=UPI0015F51E57|nr:hypothetical protein [Niallia taxi]